jgi:hypothetical protein
MQQHANLFQSQLNGWPALGQQQQQLLLLQQQQQQMQQQLIQQRLLATMGLRRQEDALSMPPPGQLLVSSSLDAALDVPVLKLPDAQAAPPRAPVAQAATLPPVPKAAASEPAAALAQAVVGSGGALGVELPMDLDFAEDEELAACLGLAG